MPYNLGSTFKNKFNDGFGQHAVDDSPFSQIVQAPRLVCQDQALFSSQLHIMFISLESYRNY